MSNLYWLTNEQMSCLEAYFPKGHCKKRVLSGIIFVNRNGLRWRDTPKDYGPPQDTLQSMEVVGGLAQEKWRVIS